MSSQIVYLISNNTLLLTWCRTELGRKYQVEIVDKDSIKQSIITRNTVECVLIDYYYTSEIELIAMYHFFEQEFNNSVFVIYDKKKKNSVISDMRAVSIYSTSGTFRKCVDCIVAREEADLHASYSLEDKPLVVSNYDSSVEQDNDIYSFDIFSGNSTLMKKFRGQVLQAASSEDVVLLIGESGCGKSYTAKYIHDHSPRSRNAYRRLNVAELTETLAESQLFGTEIGAYTDARDSEGFFSVANGGTLFLDEIGDLAQSLQSKLLDVLETRVYRKVGSMHEYQFNSRLIFATNVDLKKHVLKHKFREDLFYRIDVLRIRVPSLREHLEDIPNLVKKYVADKDKKLSHAALKKLVAYQWPGNIRELKNVLSRACTFCKKNEIESEDIVFYD